MSTTISITIGNQPWIPGQQLSLIQMIAIQTSIDLDSGQYASAASNSLAAQAYNQYLAQGGRQFVANALSQGIVTDAPASSGQVVAEEAQARADDSVTINPANPVSVLAPTGRIDPANIESGTNSAVRSQTQTQSTPPAGAGSVLPYSAPGDEDDQQVAFASTQAGGAFASTQAGAAAPRDDGVTPNNNSTAQIINASFNQRITPEPNVLDEYASYTYAISWYLLTPEQYNQMVRSQRKNVSAWQLLVQSAGAPVQTAGGAAGRNKFFSLDYYIDDLEIDSVVPLKGTGASNTATDIKFKITEPNGITLIENLYKAVSTLYKQANVSPQANYPTAQYCLVVRFYGYNQNGELVTTGRRGTNGQTNLTDPKAVVEKFYPFVITNIKFRIPKDRVVEYMVEAKPIPHFYNKSQDRGTIPFSFELTGQTVSQILVGKPVGTQYARQEGRPSSAQPNTSAPTQPSVTQPADISGSANEDVGGGTTFSLGVGA